MRNYNACSSRGLERANYVSHNNKKLLIIIIDHVNPYCTTVDLEMFAVKTFSTLAGGEIFNARNFRAQTARAIFARLIFAASAIRRWRKFTVSALIMRRSKNNYF